MGAKVVLNLPDARKIIQSRGLQDKGPIQKFLSSEVARQCDPYVPMQSGVLKNTVQVQPDGVLYDQPYAKKQYYENGGNGSDGTANGGRRGKEWDKRMIADHGTEITAAVAKKVGAKLG